MGARVVVVLDKAAIRYLGFSWEGPVGRDLNRRLRTLHFRAEQSAGFRTGELRRRMEIKRKVIRTGLEGQVGSPVKYALLHHQGTRPHVILPRRAKSLRFVVGGKVVFAKRVNHPGTRPNLYLTRWLREVVR